jgi:hypothetical protein
MNTAYMFRLKLHVILKYPWTEKLMFICWPSAISLDAVHNDTCLHRENAGQYSTGEMNCAWLEWLKCVVVLVLAHSSRGSSVRSWEDTCVETVLTPPTIVTTYAIQCCLFTKRIIDPSPSFPVPRICPCQNAWYAEAGPVSLISPWTSTSHPNSTLQCGQSNLLCKTT